MPTGYTGSLTLKTTLKDFALRCSNIEDEKVVLKVDTFTKESLDEQLELVNKLKTLNKKEKTEWFKSEKQKRKKQDANNIKAIREKKDLKILYEDLLKKVNAWQLPSLEHKDLKLFMIDQLEKSIDYDCDYSYWEEELNEPYPEFNEDYLQKVIDEEMRTLNRYLTNYQEKKDDVDTRNKWIKILLASFEEK